MPAAARTITLHGMAQRMQVPLSVTIAPLGVPGEAMAWASSAGLRGVQLGVTGAGLRPRDLGPSARRDLRATLTRLELVASGIDALVPGSHFLDPATVERAMDAVEGACGLAGDLGRVPVTVHLPSATDDAQRARRRDVVTRLAAAADRVGVSLADLAGAVDAPWPPVGIAVDPAAVLADGGDPAAAVSGAGARLAGVRVVDLLRSGLRGPVGLSGESRLDVLAFRVAVEVGGFAGLPVIDCRQWADPREGIRHSADAWQHAERRGD